MRLRTERSYKRQGSILEKRVMSFMVNSTLAQSVEKMSIRLFTKAKGRMKPIGVPTVQRTPERVVISAGVNANHGHPQPEAVDAYIGAVGDEDRVYCTNRHQTVTVHGYEDGRVRINRQNRISKSCAYDGTHY